MPWNPIKTNHIYLIYMYEEDLALNNLQGLIYHKSKQNHHIFFIFVISYKTLGRLSEFISIVD